MEDFDASQFHDVFFEDVAERIEELEKNLLVLEEGESAEAVDAVFRAAHSIKGAAATFGFEKIASFAHTLESILEQLRTDCTPRVTAAALAFVDAMRECAEVARTGKASPRRSSADAVVEVDATTIRVPAAKADQLVDLVGELVIAQSMLDESLRHVHLADRVRDSIEQIGRVMRELQERVMSVRMLPVATAFNRFPRLVRDLASSSGKRIELELAGEETELDKSLVERLSDPLTHLMRNAIDHGIEKPEERLARGKPEQGTIGLSALTHGGFVYIEVRDDGRGLDHAKIFQRALERGLVTAEQNLPPSAIEELIFAPGFSTADAVSEVSGRGVGMDVVKRTIEGMGGSISVTSKPGEGTATRLKLPLTLAMLSGMTVSVGAQTYVIPILSIVETLKARREQVKTLLGGGEVLLLRGETLPILHLGRLFSQTPRHTNTWDGVLVVVEDEGERVALLVDGLVSEQQVVVKSLDARFHRVEGVLGATVLGDGRVALIVDGQGLIRARRKLGAA